MVKPDQPPAARQDDVIQEQLEELSGHTRTYENIVRNKPEDMDRAVDRVAGSELGGLYVFKYRLRDQD